MANYNFKKLFDEYRPIIHNEEYFSNAHFLLNKSILTKAQLNFINQHKPDDRCSELVKHFLKDEPLVITELIPAMYRPDEKLIMQYNNQNYAINEEYYNFLIAKECKIYITQENNRMPYAVYKNEKYIGMIMPMIVDADDICNSISLTEHIKQLQEAEQLKQERKQAMKKCLYISNNKAVVRNLPLVCIADIVNDKAYKNVYVEADYKNNYGEIYINLGFIYMSIGRTIRKDDDAEWIKNRLNNIKDITITDYENYIEDCLKNMKFINVAEIKLMQLFGKSEEYIQALTNHRQKVIDLREQERQAEELERQQKEKQEEKEHQAIEQKALTEATEQFKQGNSIKAEMFLKLLDKHNIKLPIKTRGWVINSLRSIKCGDRCEWTYCGNNSTVIGQYAKQLKEVI